MHDEADADTSGVADGVGDGVGACVADVGDAIPEGAGVGAAGVHDGVGNGVAVVAFEVVGSSSKQGRADARGSTVLPTLAEPNQP